MIRGLYTSTTGMITQQKKMDVVTSNLTNATTPGYKSDELLSSSFADLMVGQSGGSSLGNQSGEIGVLNNGIHIDEVVTSFSEGSLEETGTPTDLGISGDGFFTVMTPGGERYTRAGNFTVAADGTLTTQDGYAVLGTDGNAVRVGNASFTVDSDGTVFSKNGTSQLKIVSFEANAGLRKQGENLYLASNGASAKTAEGKISQGYLESSNVDMVKQMTDMIEISRSYEINQRMLKMQDEKLGRAVSEIGKI